jgi:predicted amidohydrolase YtcJ
MRTVVLLVFGLALGSCGGRHSEGLPADTVLIRGKIAIVDDAFTVVEALAIRDGKVAAVGTTREIEALRGDRTRVIDLKGRTVLPGFYDSHLHVRADPPRSVDLGDARSVEEIQEKVRRKAEELGPGEWVTGRDWAEDDLQEKRRPTRLDLDAAAPDNPVTLTRAGGHSSVANSMALSLAGISRSTPDPSFGIIDKDENGEPTGWIRERAQTLLWDQVPEATEAELRGALLKSLRELLKLGITSFNDAGVVIENLTRFQDVYAGHGLELPRATLQVRLPRDEPVDEMLAVLRGIPFRTGLGNDRLKIGAIKLSVDGGYTGSAAYTLVPYKGRPDFYGSLFLEEEELTRLVREAHARGWQLGVHTIGDGAIEIAVNAFARVLEESPRPNHRHYLNHMTVKPPEATLLRIRDIGLVVAQQPSFTYTLEGPYTDDLEGERLETVNPLATLSKLGIPVGLGNDNLPIGPLHSLYAAVTRKGKSGRVFGADEAVTIQEAIRGYTRGSAYVTFDENVKGSLEPGMLADLVVLSEDILAIDPQRILEIEVEATMVGGEILWGGLPEE